MQLYHEPIPKVAIDKPIQKKKKKKKLGPRRVTGPSIKYNLATDESEWISD